MFDHAGDTFFSIVHLIVASESNAVAALAHHNRLYLIRFVVAVT